MKIGDTIRCVNETGSTSLRGNCEYAIIDINSFGNIKVKDKGRGRELDHYYKPNRFELLKSSSLIIDINKQYKTRDGRAVKILAVNDEITNNYKVVGILDGYFTTWTLSGSQYDWGLEDDGDLVEVPDHVFVTTFSGLSLEIFKDGSINTVIAMDADHISIADMKEIVAEYDKHFGATN